MAIKTSNQVTLVDVTDAYSVHLTSEAYTFTGGTAGATSGACVTQISALQGSNAVSRVVVNQTDIICPTGITAAVTGSGSSAVTVTFTISSGSTISASCEATIPVIIGDVTINKKFSFAVALTGATGAKGDKGTKGDTGATGKGVSSVTITYGSSTSNTVAPVCDATTPPSVAAGSYLWTKFVYNYTDGTSSDPAYTVSKQGSTGTAGSVWYSGTGITGTSTTATVFTGSGVSSAKVNDQYLNTSTGNTYKCTTAGNASAAKWVYTGSIKGVKGDDGEDAITVSIDASPGIFFKNSSGTITLTAHVYVAGVEKSITSAGVVSDSLGTIKWYKGTGTTAVATAKSITVNASDVTNTESYTCKLEG